MVTVEEYKEAKGITTNDKDAQIAKLIELVGSHIKSYCNITEVPAEYDLNVVKMVEFHLNTEAGKASESLSRHSVSYVSDYPPEATRGLRRKLRW